MKPAADHEEKGVGTMGEMEGETAPAADAKDAPGQAPPAPGGPFGPAAAEALAQQLRPWHEALAGPAHAQETVLRRTLADFAQTTYGADHGAAGLAAAGASEIVAAYRRAYPVVTYDDYKPLIQAVMAGETRLLLCEEPVGWAITRGTVEGESKFIPMTPTDLRMRVSAGRAMMSYVAATKRLELFAGVNLNLNFPSTVGTVRVGDRDLEYGYSSGIYTKHVSRFTPIRSAPTQDEIDALGGGTARGDWDNRFELAIEKCRNENVTLVGGVCQTALEFGRYLRKRHGVYPKKWWDTKIMTLGSTPGINTRHTAALRAMYGPAAVREIYGATEGMFGQQLDERRAWVPNYDLFFFEVLTRSGIKMLHEMRPGELGSLVVTTPILARYRIGDTILAVRPPYFRCIGRDSDWWTTPDYYWRELTSLNLGRL